MKYEIKRQRIKVLQIIEYNCKYVYHIHFMTRLQVLLKNPLYFTFKDILKQSLVKIQEE